MSLLNYIEKISDGARILIAWLGSGAVTVPIEQAQKRADICLKCPMNVERGTITGAIAAAIKEQVRIKNKLNIRVNGERALGKCDACKCELRLKIHIPIERIRPQPGDNFPDNCWIIHETKV